MASEIVPNPIIPRADQAAETAPSDCDLDALVADLFAEHGGAIRAYIHSLVHDGERAHDLTQETYLQLYRTRNRLQEVENRRAWLYRIASRVAFKELRRRKRFAWLPWNKVEDTHHLAWADPSREVQERIAVENALAELPHEQRATLLLYSRYGLRVREVATALAVSESVVKMRLHRGAAGVSVGICASGDRMQMNQHIEVQLAYYNDLSADEQMRVDRHLQTCQQCRALLASYQVMDQQLAQPPESSELILGGLSPSSRPMIRPAGATGPAGRATHWLRRLTPSPAIPIPVGVTAIGLAFFMLLAASSINPLGMAQRLNISTPTAIAAEWTAPPTANGIVRQGADEAVHPLPVARPATRPTLDVQNEPNIYAVQEGDTVTTIAAKLNVTVNALLTANPELY